MEALRRDLNLSIDDFDSKPAIGSAIRGYYRLLRDYQFLACRARAADWAAARPARGQRRGTIAIARSGPPEPPSIFIGSAMTRKFLLGSRRRFATFSNTGTPAAPSTRWLSNSFDCP